MDCKPQRDIRTRGRHKWIWMEAFRKDLGVVNLTMEMIHNRDEWKKRICVANPKILGQSCVDVEVNKFWNKILKYHNIITKGIGQTKEICVRNYKKKFSTYSTAILCWIIISIHIQLRQPANCNLLNIRHKIIRNAYGIFTNVATFMSANRVEVS